MYDTAELQCPGLIHFVYKSRQLVQITMPRWPDQAATDGLSGGQSAADGSDTPEREV